MSLFANQKLDGRASRVYVKDMTTTTTLTGRDAIRYAEAHDLTVRKHADPIEGAREGLTVSEAEEVAREDASLIWIEVEAPDLIATEARDCADCAWPEGTDDDRRESADWCLTEGDLKSIERVLGRRLVRDEIRDASRAYEARLLALRATLPPRRPGRPAREPSEGETRTVSVRLTGRERASFGTAAGGEGEIGGWLRGLGRVEAEMDAVKTECAYCGRDVPGSAGGRDVPGSGDEQVPALADDGEWSDLAAHHSADCEWIATRAHRR